MELRLTPSEKERFHRALLSAFPTRGNLEHLVFFRLGEQLEQIVDRGSLTDVVTNLIKYVESRGTLGLLLREARDVNPGNWMLREFAESVQIPEVVSPGHLRTQLINLMLGIPQVDDYTWRSSLLSDIPGSVNLTRNAGNARLDMTLMVDQLAALGQTNTSDWPLLLLIDKALVYIEGYQVETELRQLRQALESTYKVE